MKRSASVALLVCPLLASCDEPTTPPEFRTGGFLAQVEQEQRDLDRLQAAPTPSSTAPAFIFIQHSTPPAWAVTPPGPRVVATPARTIVLARAPAAAASARAFAVARGGFGMSAAAHGAASSGG